jgi:glycine/D-amino acid oxidase-like deaminating enzyme
MGVVMRRLGLALMALTMSSPVAAQGGAQQAAATDRKVAEMIETAHAVYGVRDSRAACRPKPGDEIVVCADHDEDQRIPSTAQTDPNSREARRALHAMMPSGGSMARPKRSGWIPATALRR